MDEDLDLRHFANETRLFPLPGVVTFPHAVLPLHIFEPRYRQMTEDALAGDRLITIVQLRPEPALPGNTLGEPPIATLGSLGRILQHERLPDGRFNFLLLGRKRVRLTREIPADKLYRRAVVEILEDDETTGPVESRRAELIHLFREAFERTGRLDDDLQKLLKSDLSLGPLTDLVAQALGLPPALKQALLGESSVVARAEVLLKILQHPATPGARGNADTRHFPPPFSMN